MNKLSAREKKQMSTAVNHSVVILMNAASVCLLQRTIDCFMPATPLKLGSPL
jgi:hypothetical protein